MDHARRSQEKAGPGRSHRGHKTRVILAETDDLLRRQLAFGLTEAGYAVLEAPDGRTALDRLGLYLARGDEPELIVADLALPGCSGLMLVELVRRMEWSTPVVLMMADDDPDSRAQALRVGADAVIPVRGQLNVPAFCAFIRDALPPA